MITSLLLVDVQGFETLAGGRAGPSALISKLSGSQPSPQMGVRNQASLRQTQARDIAVLRAYCASDIASERRDAYREAGFDIIETAGADETLITMALDMADLAMSDISYEHAILLGGPRDYTALARIARERLMKVSVAKHDGLPASLEALTEANIDIKTLDIDRSQPVVEAEAEAVTEPAKGEAPTDSAAPEAKADTKDETPTKNDAKAGPDGGDAWPNGKSGSILVAGTGAAAATGVSALSRLKGSSVHSTGEAPSRFARAIPEAKPELKAETKMEPKAEPKTEIEAETKPEAAPAQKPADATPADDLSAALEDEIGAELEAELLADIAPDGGAKDPVSEATPPAITQPVATPALAAPAADTRAKGSVSAPANTPGAAPNSSATPSEMPPVEEDSNIDALFADLTSPDAGEGTDDALETTSVDLAATAPSAPAPNSDADVDELLSRLMSDDLATEPAGDAKSKLSIIPER